MVASGSKPQMSILLVDIIEILQYLQSKHLLNRDQKIEFYCDFAPTQCGQIIGYLTRLSGHAAGLLRMLIETEENTT